MPGMEILRQAPCRVARALWSPGTEGLKSADGNGATTGNSFCSRHTRASVTEFLQKLGTPISPPHQGISEKIGIETEERLLTLCDRKFCRSTNKYVKSQCNSKTFWPRVIFNVERSMFPRIISPRLQLMSTWQVKPIRVICRVPYRLMFAEYLTRFRHFFGTRQANIVLNYNYPSIWTDLYQPRSAWHDLFKLDRCSSNFKFRYHPYVVFYFLTNRFPSYERSSSFMYSSLIALNWLSHWP